MVAHKVSVARFFRLSLLVSVALCGFNSSFANAAEAGDAEVGALPTIEEILVTVKGMAASFAPVKSSLEAFQPQSVITQQFIDAAVPKTGDFSVIAQFSPSASGSYKNGPGLAESKTVLRGFKDGEYNITYDGIPFGDTNDPTHHSTSFFPSSTIGTLVVDRGPGAAGQLGQANFGGSVNMYSPELGSVLTGSQTATIGSFSTSNFVTTVRTGNVEQAGNIKALLNLQQTKSDGYLTNSGIFGQNYLLKLQLPIGERVVVTAFSTYNRNRYYQTDSDGSTLAQVAQFGKNFALSTDVTSPTYFGYNVSRKNTDFDYLRLQADLGDGFKIDNNAYTYYYKNNTLSALDTTGATPNGTKAGAAGNKNIPGYSKNNQYRVAGDILRASKTFEFGELRAGAWYETSDSLRYRFDYDFTLSSPVSDRPLVADPREKTAPFDTAYNQDSDWNQYQTFADFELRPVAGLTITPGIKYVHFTRKIDAAVNQTTRLRQVEETTYTRTLPFGTANYKIQDNWAVYAQYARGFLIPPLSTLYVAKPELNTVAPQTSTNYQAGTVFNAETFTVDADAYYIDFNNKFNSATNASGDKYFYNLGGAVYKGLEAQGTYAVYEGVAVFLNGSLNSAKTKDTKRQISSAPKWTAAGGFIYRGDMFGATLIEKSVGPQWAAEGEPAAYRIKPYSTADLTLTFDVPYVRFTAGMYNLFNTQHVTAITPNSKGAAFDQYFFQTGRSVQFTMKATM